MATKSTKSKKYLGYVIKVYRKASAIDIKLEVSCLKLGDNILILGNHLGAYEQIVDSLQVDNGNNVKIVKKGKIAGVLVKNIENIHVKDKVFLYYSKRR